MQKYVPATQLYSRFKSISDEVEKNNVTFIVLKHSRPVYKITPMETENEEKKYSLTDIKKHTFRSKNPKEKNLSTGFKKYLYT